MLQFLVDIKYVMQFEKFSSLAWATIFWINALLCNRLEKSYFLKVNFTHFGSNFDSKSNEVSMKKDGIKSLKSKFKATSALVAVTPDFVLKPIVLEPYFFPSEFYFYLCDYWNLI